MDAHENFLYYIEFVLQSLEMVCVKLVKKSEQCRTTCTSIMPIPTISSSAPSKLERKEHKIFSYLHTGILNFMHSPAQQMKCCQVTSMGKPHIRKKDTYLQIFQCIGLYFRQITLFTLKSLSCCWTEIHKQQLLDKIHELVIQVPTIDFQTQLVS